MNDQRTHVGVGDVARRLGVSAEHVGALIRAGLLRASNVGLGRRAQWRVAITDLESFLLQRANQVQEAGRETADGGLGAGNGARRGGGGVGGRRSRSVGEEFV